jgi:hypothetical protein
MSQLVIVEAITAIPDAPPALCLALFTLQVTAGNP